MADQAITALPKKTYSGSSKIAATDYLLGIDSAEGYQMLIQDLGEYIINKATASLAGSTQTLASAISALNSNLTNTLKSGANSIDNLIVGGYATGSGNYFDVFVPLSTSGKTVTAASASSSTIILLPGKRIEFSSAPTITVLSTTKYGVRLEISFPSTQTGNTPGTVCLIGLTLTCS